MGGGIVTYGDHPPLEPMKVKSALTRKDVDTLIQLVASDWARLDAQRGMGLEDEHGMVVERQLQLEALQQKLEVLK